MNKTKRKIFETSMKLFAEKGYDATSIDEDLITILLSQFWGNEARHQKCQKHILEYINKIENIVEQGIKQGEIKQGDPRIIASEIYGLICSSLVYKTRNKENFDRMKLFKEFENTVIEGLRVK